MEEKILVTGKNDPCQKNLLDFFCRKCYIVSYWINVYAYSGGFGYSDSFS